MFLLIKIILHKGLLFPTPSFEIAPSGEQEIFRSKQVPQGPTCHGPNAPQPELNAAACTNCFTDSQL